MIDFLNEPHFNVPLILSWANATGRDVQDFLDQDMNVSIPRVLRSMSVDDFQALLWNNNDHKQAFIESIIRAFADGESHIYGDIVQLTDPFWPQPAPMAVSA